MTLRLLWCGTGAQSNTHQTKLLSAACPGCPAGSSRDTRMPACWDSSWSVLHRLFVDALVCKACCNCCNCCTGCAGGWDAVVPVCVAAALAGCCRGSSAVPPLGAPAALVAAAPAAAAELAIAHGSGAGGGLRGKVESNNTSATHVLALVPFRSHSHFPCMAFSLLHRPNTTGCQSTEQKRTLAATKQK